MRSNSTKIDQGVERYTTAMGTSDWDFEKIYIWKKLIVSAKI